ncbi:siderophore-iron reductase FhuF [Glaciimonas sp. GG7]
MDKRVHERVKGDVNLGSTNHVLAPTCLAELVPSQFAGQCKNVWLGPHPEHKTCSMVIPAATVIDHLPILLAAMQEYYAGDDRRALFSQWSKYYFSLVIPAVVVAARILHRPLNMALDTSTLVLRNGMPHALYLPADALGTVSADPAIRYRSLCMEHLAPQIAAFSTVAKIPQRVLWSNVGHTLEYALSTIAAEKKVAHEIAYLFERQAFFETSQPNPLHHAIRYRQPASPQLPDPMRVRRICCLRNQLPGEEILCTSCPLLLTLDASELAVQLDAKK